MKNYFMVLLAMSAFLGAAGNVSAATTAYVTSEDKPDSNKGTQIETMGTTTSDDESDALAWFFIGCTDSSIQCKMMAREAGYQFFRARHDVQRCPAFELACWGR